MKNGFLLLLLLPQFSLAQLVKSIPGKYKPGFISITCFDTSRPAVREQADKQQGRILQINIWYPSAGNTRAMCFSDYVGLIGKELDTGSANNNWLQKGIDKYFEWPASAGADKKTFTNFLHKKTPMQAFMGARWLQQKWPLVMLVHGFAADHAYLAEQLASNGYVVLQVPVKGSKTYELDYEGTGLESQVLDYEFALELLQKEFPFINSMAAAVGFSFGGQSAAALALRNPTIKVVVSFDGGIGSVFGAQLLSNQPYYQQQQFTVPILHLYNAADSYTDLQWFNSIRHSSRYVAAINNMQHGHFTSFGLFDKMIPGLMGKEAADPGHGYEAVMLLTKKFIDQSLKEKAGNRIDFFKHLQKQHGWISSCLGKTAVLLAGS
jgi:dienelactone hydrolase